MTAATALERVEGEGGVTGMGERAVRHVRAWTRADVRLACACVRECSHPGYFGKVGMRYYHKVPNRFFKPTVNLDRY
jgi:hypothetical protein